MLYLRNMYCNKMLNKKIGYFYKTLNKTCTLALKKGTKGSVLVTYI